MTPDNDGLPLLDNDGKPLAYFAPPGHPAWEDTEVCRRPEDCPHPICREEAARLQRVGAAVLSGRTPDDSDLSSPERFP